VCQHKSARFVLWRGTRTIPPRFSVVTTIVSFSLLMQRFFDNAFRRAVLSSYSVRLLCDGYSGVKLDLTFLAAATGIETSQSLS
jgi:hypothetical protein